MLYATSTLHPNPLLDMLCNKASFEEKTHVYLLFTCMYVGAEKLLSFTLGQKNNICVWGYMLNKIRVGR